MNNAQGLLTDTLQGDYLSPDSNPYLGGMLNNAMNSVQSRVNSAFGSGGRYGSGINQEVMTRELGNSANEILGGNYSNERNRQMQGMLFAPQMANQDYFDIGQLANVGAQKEGRAQGQINEDINRYNYNSNLEANALRNFIGLTGGNFGGTTTNSTPYHSNNTASTLGAGLGLLGTLGNAGSTFAGMGGAMGGLGGIGSLFSMFSDIRLKQNIRQIGFERGFPIYEFEYKAHPGITVRGVMAQDVIVKRPDAIEWEGDYMKVLYGKLGITPGVVH
jgi:hypothetical protein